ncbi:universal stress protein [Actinotalea ferrariae]|uniref:universal stress protein n=1 Tax=Actinotalea ferrariae TaxID=1386098 RepID=UPI001C8BD669|nr:universal stress protein [Actinotalea ferrariae]MBX9244812.1 universal stress protein [Actinotalea ferrariae]
MPIIVGWTPTPEGDAALTHAIAEASAHGSELMVVNVSPTSDPSSATFASDHEMTAARGRLDESGVPYTLRQLVRGKDVAEEIVDLAGELDAELVVIGLRSRSPVGKLLLGSRSQSILLDAPCPVLAVKAKKPA